MNIKNTLSIITLILLLAFVQQATAQNSVIDRATGIMQEIAELADEFNLTPKQKTQIRSIVMDHLPTIALKSSAMLNNRQELLESSLGNDEIDEELLTEIANKQGQLLTGLIISKEYLKKDIRGVLTEDQKDFVDELINTIIQYKLNNA